MMRAAHIGPVDTQMVETLLLARPRFDEEECQYAALIASAVHGIGDEDETAAADSHLAACAECRRAVLMLHSVDLNMKTSHRVGADSIRDATPKTRREPFFRAAAAAVFLCMWAFFAVYHTGKKAPPPGEGLTIKGEDDALFVAVKRGASEFTLRPLERLEQGDKLGFFYTSEKAGFLAVFNVDEDGIVTKLFPAEKMQSASIVKAVRSPLPDGATVKGGTGCEWVAAVFSDKPLNLEETGRLLFTETGRFLDETKRAGQPDACNFSPKVPGARSVVVLPVRR